MTLDSASRFINELIFGRKVDLEALSVLPVFRAFWGRYSHLGLILRSLVVSDLIVVTYPDEYKAADVLAALQRMQEKLLIDLEDAAYVMKDKDGKFKLHQTVPLTTVGARSGFASGTFWGLLIGLLFLQPALGAIMGAAVGSATGVLTDRLTDYGIPDDFMMELGQNLRNGNSTLFVLVRGVTPDKVLAEIGQYGGTVLHTTLSTEAEQKLQSALLAGKAAGRTA